MSVFLKRVFIIMAITVMNVIIVFFVLQYLLSHPSSTVNSKNTINNADKTVLRESSSVDTGSKINNADQTVLRESSSVDTSETNITDAGIYLRDLPLTDSQKKFADSVGIDVDTYYVTPETITCVESKLGDARYQEIIDGATPSVTEGIKLFGCL